MISFTRKPIEYEIVNKEIQYYNDIATWESGDLYYERVVCPKTTTKCKGATCSFYVK